VLGPNFIQKVQVTHYGKAIKHHESSIKIQEKKNLISIQRESQQ